MFYNIYFTLCIIVTLGLQWDPHGAGRVTRQEPLAGTPLAEVQVCKLTFSSASRTRPAGALVQSDRFGTSIGDTLRAYATSMREIRSSQAEESAERTAVAMLFPMVIFIFPVIMIVTVGPAGITLFNLGILGGG